MIRRPCILLVLFLAACAAPSRPAEPPPLAGDIDKAVAALADYDSSKPRAAVSEVERLVRATRGDTDLRQHLEAGLLRLLEGPVSDDCRLFICEQLAGIGSDQALPVLRKMLGDEKTALAACYALAGNPSPAATTVLREALMMSKGPTLVAVIGAVAERHDPESLRRVRVFSTDPDSAVALAAISALGRSGEPDAVQPLLDQLGRTNEPARRNAAAEGTLRLVRELVQRHRWHDRPQEGDTTETPASLSYREEASLAQMYRLLLDPIYPPPIRRGALIGILSTDTLEATLASVELLRHEDRLLTPVAIAQVRTLRGKTVTQDFAANLPTLAPHLQALLIGALADRPDPAPARAAIMAAAGSDNAAVRVAAAQALGQMGDAGAVPRLVRAASASDAAEQRVALASLRRLRADGVDAALVAALPGAAPEARVALIEVLGDRGATVAVPALLKEAQGADAQVAADALAALARLAGPETVLALTQVLAQVKDEAARAAAESATIAAARKGADEATRADGVLAALREAKAPAARASLLRVLRGIGNAQALAAVQAARNDPEAAVADAAVRALADWPDARALPAVLDLCRTTASDTHRIVALRGAVRLLALPDATDTIRLTAYADLLTLARRPEEKKLVLGGLGGVAQPGALALIEPCLSDEAVKAEAALALLQVARAIASTYRGEVKTAMMRVAANATDPAVQQQAQQMIRQIEQIADYLVTWQVAGPYMQQGKPYTALFDLGFAPETPEAKGVTWKLATAGPQAANPARPATPLPIVVDLAAAVGAGNDRAAYARTWVHSPQAQDARLEMGSDDGLKVVFNGAVIYGANIGGACIPGSHKADVQLRAGWNLLLLKVTQSSGPWEFCARLCRRDGGRLEGVRADARGEVVKP